jgi:hypothetical protein
MTIATQLEETAAPFLILAVNCLAGKQLSLRWRPCLSIYNLLLMARHQMPANTCWLNECPATTTLLVFSADNSLALGVRLCCHFLATPVVDATLPAAAMPKCTAVAPCSPELPSRRHSRSLSASRRDNALLASRRVPQSDRHP